MKPKFVTLKDGEPVYIREYDPTSDFEKLEAMYISLTESSEKWGYPPFTRDALRRWEETPGFSAVAVIKEEIIGHSRVFDLGGHSKRHFKVGELITYLHESYRSVGLGTTLTTFVMKMAAERGFHRLRLSVVTENEIAIHLYEKLGFRIEGTEKASYYGDDGQYHDEVLMGLILG